MPYMQFKMRLSPEQQKKVLQGKTIRVEKADLGVGSTIMLHPSNFAKVTKAKSSVNLTLSPGEVMQTAEFHGLLPGDLELTGAGIFDSIWSGLKSAGRFLKDSGLGSAILDVGQQLATPVLGPEIAGAARGLAKGLTGVGAKKPARIRRNLKASGLYL